MGVQGNVEICPREPIQGLGQALPGHAPKRDPLGLALVGRHERSASRVPEEHDVFHALLPKPAHPYGNFAKGMIEAEKGFGAPELRIPAEKAVTPGSH